MKKLNIGLFGFGVVGEGIYKVLAEKENLGCSISKIVIKDANKKRNAPQQLFTTNADEVLNDENVDIVVELIDDAKAAFKIVKQAMENGKSVVSANKKMIAENHIELLHLQQEHKVSFLYEAAVCGSIPILRNLEEYFDNDLLTNVGGIVNGSTNYILTKMKDEKADYHASLQKAQESGFAESDPTLDVEAYDAAYKLSIIILHAFGKVIHPQSIIRKGITALSPEDFTYADEKGLVIKLIANSTIADTTADLQASIFPTFIEKEQTLSRVNNEYNGVLIGSSLADEQFLYGKGAGRYPTSSAVLSDISALKYNYKYALKKGLNSVEVQSNNISKKFYIAKKHDAQINLNIFESLHEHYKNCDREYVVGEIKLENFQKFDFWKNDDISIIAFS